MPSSRRCSPTPGSIAPELPLQCSDLELGSWAGSRLADWQACDRTSGSTSMPCHALPWRGDTRLLDRALEKPHRQRPAPCHQPGKPAHGATGDDYLLEVADAAPASIRPGPQIFRPFVRLDRRDRRTGGRAGARHRAQHRPPPAARVQLLPSSSGADFCLTLPVHLDTNPSPVAH